MRSDSASNSEEAKVALARRAVLSICDRVARAVLSLNRDTNALNLYSRKCADR